MGFAGKCVQLLGRLRAAGRFAEQPLFQRQGLIGTDDVFTGLLADTNRAFSRASMAAISPGAVRPEDCCMARSSISAGIISKSSPASASSVFLARLCDARINFDVPRHSVIPEAAAAAGR